jgi:hypothetical protein
MQLDLASAQMDGNFPQVAFERDGGIEPHTPGGSCEEKPLPVGVGGKLAQACSLLREALGRRLATQSAVDAAKRIRPPAIARSGCLSNRDHGQDRAAAALRSPLHSLKKRSIFPFAPRIRPGMERDPQIGADHRRWEQVKILPDRCKASGQAAAGGRRRQSRRERSFRSRNTGHGAPGVNSHRGWRKEGAQHALGRRKVGPSMMSAIQSVLGSSVSKAFVGPFVRPAVVAIKAFAPQNPINTGMLKVPGPEPLELITGEQARSPAERAARAATGSPARPRGLARIWPLSLRLWRCNAAKPAAR